MSENLPAPRTDLPSVNGGGRVIDVEAKVEDAPRSPPEKDFSKREGDRQNVRFDKEIAGKGTPERTRHTKAESKVKKGYKAVTEAVSEVASTVARKSAPVVEKAAVTTGRLAKKGLEETFDVDISSDSRGYTVKRRKHKRRVVKKKRVVKHKKVAHHHGRPHKHKAAPRSASPKKESTGSSSARKAAPKKKRNSQIDKWADSDWFI